MTLIVIASTAATTTAEARSALGAIRLGLGLIDGQSSPAQFFSVQRSNRLIGFARIGHFDKSKASRTARFAVCYQADFFHRSMRLESSSQFGLGCAVGQISDVK